LTEHYEEKSFTKLRQIVSESVEYGLKKHHMKVLMELDVTIARDTIREKKKITREAISFTAFLVKCIGQAVSEHKGAHGLRKGKKIIIFDDIDISVMVERIIDGESFPTVFVIRKTNEKSVREIHKEIRETQLKKEKEAILTEFDRKLTIFLSLPKSLRKFFFWRKLMKDPFFRKKHAGTVNVTSVGMFAKNHRIWGFSPSNYGLSFTIGSIVKKPGILDNKVVIREFLYLTVFLDHDIIDGAPAARFIAHLAHLIENPDILSDS
jgi:pyruvate/2-oxoglutarate dehydrogenase complex dihydrolipoamide acyltransferase (E2) component